jgi:cephalosporin-C deacetylase-like acetyl esterase
MTTVLNDAIIAVNVLVNHSKINKDCIGVLGHSFGGNTTIFHTAVDERIKFACASGAACSFKNKMENETGI